MINTNELYMYNSPVQKLRTDWVRLPKRSQKAMLQILILKELTIQSLAGANRAVIRTMDFLFV